MTTLPNFPMVNQNTTITEDGSVSNNAQMDCVAASIGAAILYFQGKSQWDSEVNPDVLKDMAYSEGYTGGTAASAYVPLCQSLGVKLYPYNNGAANLIGEVRNQLVNGHPVVFTENDPYVDTSLPQYRGWTHVCIFMGADANGLTAMDPYIARAVYKSDATWASLLVAGQIWILEEDTVKIDLSNPEVAGYFEVAPTDPNAWLCKTTQKIIHGEILATYQGYGNEELCGLTKLGLPKSNEIAVPGHSPCTIQFYERGCLVYDPNHVLDHPPGSGQVYPAQVYGTGALGQDPIVIPQLTSEVATLTAEIATLKAVPPPVPLPPIPDQALVAAINQIKAIVATV